MASLTIREIPDDLLERLRRLSRAERRSLNSQILVLLERTLGEHLPEDRRAKTVSVDAQVALWSKLADEWDDPRSAAQIAMDIRAHRTGGRMVTL